MSGSNSSSREAAEQQYKPTAAAAIAPQQRKKGPNTVRKLSKIVVLIKGKAQKKFRKEKKFERKVKIIL